MIVSISINDAADDDDEDDDDDDVDSIYPDPISGCPKGQPCDL